ncbi:tripartite motif-containing protein 5-like [Hippopotamus amphibius kiboko]|uniref:tripartite motif-containing protein 5-like n=1 Tax=Hippopotamus amphibius kiboko TaxID=575201 RepID=UPI00259A7D8B|nr:tripartite motif-containing protein 5-like [Hippopotamus amphibius kiboko]XP_057551865.1 tripartite motif-containing protein 5-like [Hippopotamus amphibius kiboko]
MASGHLVKLQEEVTCPICLELLKEPLSLGCGHTFCQACITAKHKEAVINQEGENSCPVCRIGYEPRNLQPNRHLANIVERLREIELSLKEQEGNLCVCHGEKLLLFCEEDGKVICWLCERSQEHRGHHTLLMEEIAKKYQKMLQVYLERLKGQQQEAEELECDFREKIATWKNQIQHERQNIQAEFKKLRVILDNEELKKLQELSNEEEVGLHNMADSEHELAQQSQLVRDLISDLECRLQGSAMEMLQDVNSVMQRSETLILKKPTTFSEEQRIVFRAPDLRDILRVFNELRDVQRHWVHVTLNPPKGISSVAISADARQVRYEHNHQQYAYVRQVRNVYNQQQYNQYCNIDYEIDYEDNGVLGSPVITSGRHYWEVDVSAKRAWILGVYSGKCPGYNAKLPENKGLFQCSFGNYKPAHIYSAQSPAETRVKHQSVYSRYQPKYGYWVIELKHGSVYNAFNDSSSSDPLILPLFMSVPPYRIGVFLDYEARTVSFLNVTNHGFVIYKFSSCSFSENTYPYFNPMQCDAPMTLCSPDS